MQRKSFGAMPCPIARSLERVGEWWSILILRDAFQGLTRFDQFQKGLDIAPNILTRRLNSLVEAGLFERHRYSETNTSRLTARASCSSTRKRVRQPIPCSSIGQPAARSTTRTMPLSRVRPPVRARDSGWR